VFDAFGMFTDLICMKHKTTEPPTFNPVQKHGTFSDTRNFFFFF